MSDSLGKETIDLYNNSENRGKEKNYGINYQKIGEELMTVDELAVMDSIKWVLQLRGVRPVLSNKFDIRKNVHYKLLGDFDKRNNYDVEKQMQTNIRFRKNGVIDLMEVDFNDEQ